MSHTIQKSATIAGVSLLAMAIIAAFSYGFVHESLVSLNDEQTTFTNIQSSLHLFKLEIFGWILIVIADVIVSWALYLFFKPTHPTLSLLAALLRIIYTVFLGIAILNLVFVFVIAANELQQSILLFLQAFEIIWTIGLIIFGGHLLMIGYMMFQPPLLPKTISTLLLLAGIGYIITSTAIVFFSSHENIVDWLNTIFMLPMILGELSLAIWLIIQDQLRLDVIASRFFRARSKSSS